MTVTPFSGIMRAIDLHKTMLEKQISKLQSLKYNVNQNTLRPVLLRADSKGRSLLPYINYRNKINLVFRGGATIRNDFLQSYTLDKIAKLLNPVVILWFGSCEMTRKQGKYISLVNNPEHKLDQIKNDYIAYKQQIMNANKNSTIIFLECPYQSIVIWNFVKGHPYPGAFKDEQKILEQYVTKLNRIIKELNGDQVVPHLSQDMIFSIKKKKRASKYLKNFSLLTDGVHPSKTLSKLWHLRIMRMLSYT